MGIKNLSWNDYVAIMNHYKPSVEQAAAAFGKTVAEVETAVSLEATGTFVASKTLDVEVYADIFNDDGSIVKPTNSTPSSTSITKPEAAAPVKIEAKAETASKAKKVPQKRGRKGNKIATAFAAIPSTPVAVVDFAKEHNVSVPVLRQSRRFDSSDAVGKVMVRKDKVTGVLNIWRESE